MNNDRQAKTWGGWVEHGRQKFFTKVRMELWEKFWQGERHNWIKEPERQAPHGDETAEAADIGDLFGGNNEMCACGTHRREKKHQIAPV